MMNERLLAACRPLSTEQLGTSVEGTYGTIAATLVHIANAQVAYAHRLLENERSEPLPEDPFPGFDAVTDRMDRGNADLERAAGLRDAGRTIVVTGDDPPGKWEMRVRLVLLQAINHGTEHRSQISTILTQLGVHPPDMDGWTYFEDSGQLDPV